MNEINGFTFYKNYYELIDNLSTEDKRLMLEVIVDYIFRDVEPIGLEKMNLAIWNNLKMPLSKSKRQSLNGNKGGAPIGNNNAQKAIQKQAKNNPKTSQKQTNNISIFYFLISNFNFLRDKRLLREKIEEWLKYKWERKEYYKETGFKTLLARIEGATNRYGEEKVINLINECMASNYKGIIFEKLESKSSNKNIKKEVVPGWIDKNPEIKEPTEESKREMEELINAISK